MRPLSPPSRFPSFLGGLSHIFTFINCALEFRTKTKIYPMFRQIAKLHRFLDTLHTTHNSFIRSDEGLTFETSVSLRNSLKMIVNSVSNITQFLCPKQLNRTSNKPTRSKTFKIKHSYAASQTKYLKKQIMALPRYFFFVSKTIQKFTGN